MGTLLKNKKFYLGLTILAITTTAAVAYVNRPKEEIVVSNSFSTENVGKDTANGVEETKINKAPIISEKITKDIEKKEVKEVQNIAKETSKENTKESPKTVNPKKDNSTPAPAKKASGKATTYRNSKHGIELTFPADWQNKYVVYEDDDGFSVCYEFQHDAYGNECPKGACGGRYLFCIRETSKLNENQLGVIDGIRGVPKRKIIHGREYAIGGPTDYLGPQDHPDGAEIERLLNELPGIIANLKEI